ncbi:hypothetical protein BH20ACT15_BH20ACT15_08940 [soil metagenome]
MEMLKKFEPLVLFVMIVGALNWGILGVTGGETNVLAEIFGTGTFTDVVYAVIGLCGLYFVPRLLDALHVGAGPHPRGT